MTPHPSALIAEGLLCPTLRIRLIPDGSSRDPLLLRPFDDASAEVMQAFGFDAGPIHLTNPAFTRLGQIAAAHKIYIEILWNWPPME